MDLWENWNKRLEFLEHIPSEELRLHVGFLHFLGAPIAKDYWRAQQFRNGNLESANKIIADFQRITKDLKEEYLWSENDLNAELFSVDFFTPQKRKILLNSDVVRTQIDITNLVKFNLLDKVKSIVEIGGGYGHLALAIVKLFPNIEYTIVDFPQQLRIVNKFLSHNGLKTDFSSNSRVKLVNQESINKPISCDLIINVNSFCEMSTDEITRYVNQSRIKYRILYSNNREIQFMNKELSIGLSHILNEHGYIYPKLNAYSDYVKDLNKYVFICSPDSNFCGARLLPIPEILRVTKGDSSEEFLG